MSQTLVAGFTGVSRPSVGAIERKGREPRATELMRAAALFRMRPEYLVEGRYERLLSADVPDASFRADREKVGRQLDALDRHELALAWSELDGGPSLSGVPELSDRRPMNLLGRKVRVWLDQPPTGCLDLFRSLCGIGGLTLNFTALSGLSGALLRRGGRACILVNADQPDDRLRWTAAHELAHLVLGHDPQAAEHIDDHGAARRPEDKTADLLAAELLMPASSLLGEVQELPHDLDADAIYELSSRYAVSYAAMLYRLANLQVLQFEAIEELRTERPTELADRSSRQPRAAFDAQQALPPVVKALRHAGELPSGWERDFDAFSGPAHLRLIQSAALSAYFSDVEITDRGSSVNAVYESVAEWVASSFPYAGA